MAVTFAKAVKYEAKGRVALIGPAGSGKSYTMLVLARLLAGPTGKIAALDTEHGSLSKYADLFDFDVIEPYSFTADTFLSALRAAEQSAYTVFCCDSLSHFWMGRDGALEFVDQAKKRSSSRDDMSGWKEFRPVERQMMDAMIASPLHIICTMRTKTAYEEQVNERTGKKQRVKIGLAPVQREGLEYEFDLVGLMDEDNTFIVDKTRCSALSGKALSKPSEKDFTTFRDWLSGVAAPVAPPAAQQPQRAAAPAPAPNSSAPPTTGPDPVLDGSQLKAHVLNVEERQSKGPNAKPFLAVKVAGKIGKNSLLFCWHVSLSKALSTAKGNTCLLEVEHKGDFINVIDVLAVGSQDYRDGEPFNPDAEPVMAGARTKVNPEITDDDIPF